MSVLMRKPELVRRYCCILQVLESSIDLINEDKMTPLHLAIRDNSLEIIEILLAFGANPAVKDRRGNTSLHMATAAKSTDILSMLVKNVEARDVNSLNEYGRRINARTFVHFIISFREPVLRTTLNFGISIMPR